MTATVSMALDRRSLIAAGVGVAAVGAISAPVTAATARRLDPARPDDARAIVRKLHYRTDNGLLFWWIKGTYFADIQSTLTPLFGLSFVAIQQVEQRGDGGFDVSQMELGFRTDLDTGAWIKEFKNPLNGRITPVPFNPIGPSKIHYSADAVPTVPSNLGGSQIDFQPFPEKPFVVQDQVFVQYRAQSRVRTAGVADRTINDISMLYGPAAQALDPAVTSVDAWLHSSDVTSFPRWMNMGDAQGSVTLRGIGAKVMRIGDMPKDLLGMIEAYDPSILADPAAVLRRPPATYKG